MSALALLMVLVAAVNHATWNYLVKRAAGGTAFVWLFGAVATLCYFPVALWVVLVQKPAVGLFQILFMLGTALLHTAYFLLLENGYRIGDLSVIYPLARGTGPLLSTLTAILFLGERPSPVALAGAVLIGAGVFLLSGRPGQPGTAASRKPIYFAIGCGAVIAAYTIWDKLAVSTFGIPPLLQDWSGNFGRMLLLTPYMLRHRVETGALWRGKWRLALGVGLLCPLSYILVLTALTFSPVSYIAPAREISILFGTFFGMKFLAEGQTKAEIRIRAAAAAAMVLGLVGLAVG